MGVYLRLFTLNPQPFQQILRRGMADTYISFPSTFSSQLSKKCYTATHGVTLFDEELFPGDKAAAIKACSDHLPVCRVVTCPS
jgi:hypothetical protein